MNWSRPDDLLAQLQRLWDRGDLLASIVPAAPDALQPTPLFPRRLALRGPSSGDITDQFASVRAWVAQIRALPHCRVEMRSFRHRLFGTNEVPDQIWVDSLDDAMAWLGKRRDLAHFNALVETTRQQQPLLLPWLAQRPLQALALTHDWQRLLDVVQWLQQHPRPGIYARQIDVAGVHSKFVEAHRTVLADLLDLALPEDAIDRGASGAGLFEERYGLLRKPLRIRLRLLDPALLAGPWGQDVTLDAGPFAQLPLAGARVFMTENETNFLTLPAHPRSLVVFGAGYGFDVLRQAQWLAHCPLHYWGDIDTHGFAILDQLRHQWPHAQSFLMDKGTLQAHAPLWGQENQPTRRELPRLTEAEAALYDDLRDNRLQANLRLEQEHVGFGWVQAALQRLQD
ncbi:DUF3322 domain-containing protein [Acidovorax sp.]|uniref:DUF3322 domain-containing protein n=1 Tax=Acidovorax sp. TaxID=1872122 RepID=UPI003D0634B9